MSLGLFFDPQSVAVVGASRQPGKVGHEVLSNLLRGGYAGRIIPVNPRAESIEGLACAPSLGAIGAPPDLVVITVPAQAVPQVIEECGRVQVRAVVIITSGFREAGPAGADLERSVVETARAAGIRVLGPNCLGVMSTPTGLNASFGGDLPPRGGIGYVSQSGSLLAAIVDLARAEGLGFSRLVSIGNAADLNELDVLRALEADPQTHVIAGYLETIADGDAFIREAERVSRTKPILLMKSGITEAGKRASTSHTGRLITCEVAYESVFRRAGIVRCPSLRAQFDFARAFAAQPLPAGPQVAVIANAGGAGIMAADAIEREGLVLAEFSDRTHARLRAALPPAAHHANPIDLLGDARADRYECALDAVLGDPKVDSAVVLLSPHAMTDTGATAEAIVQTARRKSGKPVLACFLGAERVVEGIRLLRAGGIPDYQTPESAVAAVAMMASYAAWRARPRPVVRRFPADRRTVQNIIEGHLRQGHLEIGEAEAKAILGAYGFVIPRSVPAASAREAVDVAQELGYPVVLKVASPDIVHKVEAGGVRTGLSSAREVSEAYDLMMSNVARRRPEARINGALIEEMCPKGRETILGMTRDPRFGPLMMFGLGGVMVEVLREVVFHPAPLADFEARDMLRRSRTFHLLAAGDGAPAVDLEAVVLALQRLSQLVTEFPQIDELDINPYIVGPPGTPPVAADAYIRLRG